MTIHSAVFGGIIALTLVMTSTPSTAAADSYQDRLERLASSVKLPKDAVPRLDKALAAVRGYGVCSGPLKTHLQKSRPHWLCEQLGGYVAYLLRRKADRASMVSLMAKRQRLMCSEPPHPFNLRGRPHKGDATDPKVTLVEYFDFQCWACQRLSGVLDSVLKHFKHDVALYHKQYPLKSHKNSALASKIALAAHRQGQYWDMANLLFVVSPDHTKDNIFKYTAELKIDIPRLKTDLASSDITALVVTDKKEGRKAGIKATPALFINGRMSELPDDEVILVDVITEILRRRDSAQDPSCP